MLDAKEYFDLYGSSKQLSNGDHVSEYFLKAYPEIEKSFEHSIVDACDVPDLPKTITCKVHGDYELKAFPFYTRSRYSVNAVCPSCVDERDEHLKNFKSAVDKERAKRKIISNLENSGLSKRHFNKTFDNYVTDTSEKQSALTKCKILAEQIKNDTTANNLIMVGGVGTGKTHLASAILRDIIENGKRCSLWSLIEIIRSLKATWAKDSDDTEERILKHLTNTPLLIIDEVGVQFGSDTEKMFIFDIINGRYENMLPTVIISNLDINGVKELIGERCVDRLREDGGQVVAFNWDSNRGKQ